MQIATINIGKKRRFPFVVKDHAGTVDTTTAPTLSSDASNASVAIDPDDPRSVIVSAFAQTPSGSGSTNSPGNVHITVAAFGKSDLISVFVPAPPDQASVSIGTPGDEF